MIGREKERQELEDLYNSPKAEFVALYGRRRVGKTYLISQTFSGRITFEHTGLSEPAEGIRDQLKQFYFSLVRQGMKESSVPKDWLEAFFMLEMFLETKKSEGRIVVFLDELPWLDTPRSGFITALEGFWNNWGCKRDNLLLIVSGSATSWILNKLINNHGGLYNRVTYEIKLEPFTLKECREFLEFKLVKLSDYDITQAYMIIGGIPYYLEYFAKGLSLAQNIDNLFFSKNAKLKFEFERLFASTFNNPSPLMAIVRMLSTRSMGYTRKEIAKELKRTDNEQFSKDLMTLEASSFILRYVPFGVRKNEKYYKLIDPFCIFYLNFVENREMLSEEFWKENVASHSIITWRGFAFENVCFNHIPQIKKALGISGVTTSYSAWANSDTQIDLLIKRKDNTMNMCELKFYSSDFTVTKSYYEKLKEREVILSDYIPRRMAIHTTLVTTFGLKYNNYSSVFSNTITLKDLFSDS